MTAGRLTALALTAALATAGCGPGAGHHPADLVVGSRAGIESTLLADVYTGALRSYGFPAHTEQAPDPLSKLDSGAFVVVPSFTGRVLQAFQPGADVRADAQVYKAMIGALPEGIAAGDYATAAEDKPALAVAGSTVEAVGRPAISACWPSTATGWLSGRSPAFGARGGRRLPVTRWPRIPGRRNAFRGLCGPVRWQRPGPPPPIPNVPADLVVLTDGKPALVQAENVVPLYRRNELTDRQLLAVNEVAGVLDTAALVDMRRQVTAGADPRAVADAWLNDTPARPLRCTDQRG